MGDNTIVRVVEGGVRILEAIVSEQNNDLCGKSDSSLTGRQRESDIIIVSFVATTEKVVCILHTGMLVVGSHLHHRWY
jgi:hypothetical protein